VIWPSEQCSTVLISSAKTFPPCFDNPRQPIQGALTLAAMRRLNFFQPIQLQLLLRARRAHDVHLGQFAVSR